MVSFNLLIVHSDSEWIDCKGASHCSSFLALYNGLKTKQNGHLSIESLLI